MQVYFGGHLKLYLMLSGSIFLIVGFLHGLRVAKNWPLKIQNWTVPMAVSVVACVGPISLAVWAFRLACR